MKKVLSAALSVFLVSSLLIGCRRPAQPGTPGEGAARDFDRLVVYFVPSREPGEIIAATEPLKGLLKDELGRQGFNVQNIDIQVGTNYEAVGEALSAGTADVGFIPGGTYVLYDDGAEVLLTATRAGLNKDSEDPREWNDGEATLPTEEQVTYYRSLILAGPSEKGRALAAKINAGEELTEEDVKGVTWGVRSPTSSAGYIYPTIWLQDRFGISIPDLPTVVQTDSYGSTMARLSTGQIDVGVIYADARRDYEERWTTEYGRPEPIWAETDVIGVTPGIYNDTISVSRASRVMTEELKNALRESFINISKTEEGRAVIAIYAHEGYQPARSEDYDGERRAQEILRGN
jgi:phosphonate transport system substrate-binding protein